MVTRELDNSEAGQLPRQLDVTALVLLIIGFNAPIVTMAGFAQLAVGYGNGIGAPVSFLIGGAILLIFSVGFVGMSRFIDNPGAFYRYITVGIGRTEGLAGAFLAIAAYILLGAGSYPYMGLVLVEFLTRVTGHPILSWQLWTIVFWAVISGIGFFRMDVSVKFLGKLVALELALVTIWEVAVAARGGPEGYSLASFTPSGFYNGPVGLGVLFAMLTMIGVETGACLSAETKEPDKTVPRATYIAIIVMAVSYGIGTWCYIITQGGSHAVHSAITNPVGSFFTSVHDYVGVYFSDLASLTVVTSLIVAINSIQAAASRYLFALGRDRALPTQLGRVHPRLQSPYIAVATNAAINLIILLAVFMVDIPPVSAYAGLTGMGIYCLLPFLIMTSASIIVFYKKNRHLEASGWTRLVAPAMSVGALSILFVLTSLNLKVIVGTAIMARISMIAVIFVPVAGWWYGKYLQKTRASTLATIGEG
jgi:amino acid transporter